MRLILSVLIAAAGTAGAGSITVGGSIGAASPTMPVVFITTPLCTGQGATPVHYATVPFQVDTSGVYNFSQLSPNGFASLYLYQNSFNPASGTTNCVAADNSGNPVEFSFGLTAGTPYIAVPFDDTFDQLGGTFSLTIDGPGNITAAVPEPSTVLFIGTGLFALMGHRLLRKRSANR